MKSGKGLKRMKSGKAVGPDDIPVEVWKCLGEAAVEFLASLFNRVLESERMPEEWRRSVLVPIFKNKGDVQSCSNYRGIKLMSHTMKLWERVVEARLRKVVEICEQQYGFMPRKSTTDAIFALRILMEKYRDGQRELHCVFVDLEKAYDRVPREELWYCMRKSGVAEKYVRVVQDMYERSRTVVRCAVGQTEEFNVEVGLHQGSALSPFLFAIVMDHLSEEVRQESPWTMMFADDIVICSESREQVEENLERWRFALERRGMKVSRSKTEYMCVNEREGSGTVRLQGEEVQKVQDFKYLGSTVQSNGECGKEAKEDAFRNGDRVLYNQARNTLNKEIRVAKRSYAKKLENQFSANDPASVWKGLKYITNYKTPSPSTEANQQLAEDLNEFYCRFETAGLTPHAPSEHLSIQPLTPPATPLSPPPALRISEDDVRQIFLKQKKRKAPGPDGVTPVCLRTCADQLAFIFSQIFNRSLELCEVPACFKRSTIIPIPKKPKMTGFNDYRPVALTSVVMKSFERLVLAYLKNITGPLLDPLQFAYRANRSVDDAVNMGLHFILQHLDKSGTYVRLLFVDFSSAFNTIIPTLLQTKLTQLSVPSSICQWITSFLTDRHQLVKLGKFKSNRRTTSTGAPQGCVLSPLLFSLYTNDCTSTDPSIKLLKFADDTTVIGLIQDGDESAYRQEIEQLAAWCSRNNLELNTLKTVEMIVDFRRNTPALPPLTIMNSTVPTVASFRFLGTTISQDLKWDTHIDATIKKAQQRLYFLRQLRKFNLPQELLIHFYSAVIESVLCTSITVWFGSATKSDMRRLQRTVRTAERIIGAPLPTLQELYTSRVRKRALKITLDPSHPGHILFDLLPSGRRYRAANTRTARHKNSFFPQAIYVLNS
ncbi:hypothetical protein QTP86_028650 [Hemibagrus guttatus]|nr:hypothetical protein QTP86_028650 [Hemibagrus guttatus]